MTDLVSLVGFLLVVTLCVVVFLVVVYNSLQRHSQRVQQRVSEIQACMKTRVDLVSQLMEIAKGYADHEALTQIAVATRENATAGGVSQKIEGVVGAFSQLARAYPELKANESYQILMTELRNVETELLRRRDQYSEAARAYNTFRSSIPTVLFASRLGFENAPYFVSGAESTVELSLFRTDSGDMLNAMLGDVAKSIGAKSKSVSLDMGEKGRRLVESGKSKLEELRSRDAPEE